MKCATHLTYGILTGVAYSTLVATNPGQVITVVALSSLGSLLPDIDSKSSIISNTLIFPKYLPLKHRGIMHSVTLSTVATITNVPFGLGMFSHILLDLLNYKKIKLFAPFSNKKFALKLVKSGGYGDNCARIIGTGLIIWILFI